MSLVTIISSNYYLFCEALEMDKIRQQTKTLIAICKVSEMVDNLPYFSFPNDSEREMVSASEESCGKKSDKTSKNSQF